MVSTGAAARREAKMERKKTAQRKTPNTKLKRHVFTPMIPSTGKTSKEKFVYGSRRRLFQDEIATLATKRRELRKLAQAVTEQLEGWEDGPKPAAGNATELLVVSPLTPRPEAEVAAAAATQREAVEAKEEQPRRPRLGLRLNFSSLKKEKPEERPTRLKITCRALEKA